MGSGEGERRKRVQVRMKEDKKRTVGKRGKEQGREAEKEERTDRVGG